MLELERWNKLRFFPEAMPLQTLFCKRICTTDAVHGSGCLYPAHSGTEVSYMNNSRVVFAIGCCITSSSFFTILSPQTQSSKRSASLPNSGAAPAYS